jgi:hypothetical protein
VNITHVEFQKERSVYGTIASEGRAAELHEREVLGGEEAQDVEDDFRWQAHEGCEGVELPQLLPFLHFVVVG